MGINILAIGDIVGEIGVEFLCSRLRRVINEHDIKLVVANGENAAGVGITPTLANRIYHAGVDVITLGNHVWGKREIVRALDDESYILRPANLSLRAPGKGFGIFQADGRRVLVINLLGRCGMDFGPDNPFLCVENILKRCEGKYDFAVVDFHASATSEKLAMSFFLDSRVAALWGTHTHVQTADELIRPGGLGYITDLGMTGPVQSVLGIKPEQSLCSFLGEVPRRYETAEGECAVCGAVFKIEGSRCVDVKRLRIS